MKRAVDLAQISDGRLYRGSDLVKLDTGGCRGCSECCRAMEKTIVLDPYDIWRLNRMAGLNFDALLDGHAELVLDGALVLPVLSMRGEEEVCTFLDCSGRCSIHAARPGICRLFPLGRYYEGGDFRYFLQTGECGRTGAKVRIRKWMDTPDFMRYEDFIRSWHSLCVKMEHFLAESSDALRKTANLYILEHFYRMPWDDAQDSFYGQYEQRLREAEKRFGFLSVTDRKNAFTGDGKDPSGG